mmetsp:Transcript_3284/g.5866  ORF Transcript_3284/g.5866 Transcript_3284/m.5866 type:complete len:671 (-) Transcript_3284:243-2255(-)
MAGPELTWWSALMDGDAATVRTLARQFGTVYSSDGWLPLHFAASRGHLQVVQELLRAGVDPQQEDWTGRAPLRCAAYNGHEGVVSCLLAAGVSVDSQNSRGWSALHLACQQGHRAAAHCLLKAGADVNLQDAQGQSAMAIAHNFGRGSILELLHKHTSNYRDRKTSKGLMASQGTVEDVFVDHVIRHAIQGDPESILEVADKYCWEQRWMMHVGDVKGSILDEQVLACTPRAILELGTYCGYSAVRMARLLRANGCICTVDIEQKQAAQRLMMHAGMEDRIHMFQGTLADCMPRIVGRLGRASIDLVFIDHDKKAYLDDLLRIEQADLLHPGSIVVADNVGIFNVNDYLQHVRDPKGPYESSVNHQAHLEYEPEHPDSIEVSVYRGRSFESPTGVPQQGSEQPSLFVTHGAGPCFFCDDFDASMKLGPRSKYAKALRSIWKQLPAKPRSVILVSAHWENEYENTFTVNTCAAPPMLYDYGGFPEHTYELKYPAPGNPKLAELIQHKLEAAGLTVQQDARRGFDHGVFIPLLLMLPQADIPVVQISLNASLDEELHLRMGEALSTFRREGVLVVGSGSSIHGRVTRPEADAFAGWLESVVTGAGASYQQQRRMLLGWKRAAPHGRKAHPRSEHLLPLHVCFGAGLGNGRVAISEQADMYARGVTFQSFLFG